ncbi:hypothetical protein ACHAXS_013630 [Conticribra weissflogii]
MTDRHDSTSAENQKTFDLSPTFARKLLLATTCGDLLLYLLFRGDIPRRDYIACKVGLGLIISLTAFEMEKKTERPKTKRFRSIFATLSAMEVIFTVLIPWLVILEGVFNKAQTRKNGNLLASHLFIFQAQIAGECVIAMTGERRKWLIFPFTCMANAYRAVTIGTWIIRVMEEDTPESRDVILPAIAGCLWIYSSFVFIPFEWYPQLKK